MSDVERRETAVPQRPVPAPPHPDVRRRDDGMTLIELLVSMMVLGTILTVLAASMVLVFRQQPETRARADVARWEQGLALWLPDDLSSASDVSGEPGATCPGCSFGTNALWLSWGDGSESPAGDTVVSYRYGPSGDGETYELRRIKCTPAGGCRGNTVLGDLAGPTDASGNPVPWSAGDEIPESVIDVALPLEVDSTLPSGDEDDTNDRAKRVTVAVNGMPGPDGVDRSSVVTFTAGGAGRGTLEPAEFSGPQFLAADSGCGGVVTLVVDTSGSVGSAMPRVINGVRSFVRAFDGTPTDLQIVRFSNKSSVLGASDAEWNRFWDLSEPNEVSDLLDTINGSTFVAAGGTNWEDAVFRAFHAPDGVPYDELPEATPYGPAPDLVVFFTDGKPTFDRVSTSSHGPHYSGDASSRAPNPSEAKWLYTDSSGSGTVGAELSPRAWKRTRNIIEGFPGVRTVAVGVGEAFRDPDGSFDETLVDESEWPTQAIPHEVFLGTVISGGDPSVYPEAASGNYVMREYSDSSGWGDVDEADVLVTDDFSQFGGALTKIALSQCGGSLTLQTRDSGGARVDDTVVYRVGEQTVSTGKYTPSGTFDLAIDGVASKTVDLVPEPLGAGLVAQGWACKAGGVERPDVWSLLEPGNPAAGIEITVTASQAMSCTMRVS